MNQSDHDDLAIANLLCNIHSVRKAPIIIIIEVKPNKKPKTTGIQKKNMYCVINLVMKRSDQIMGEGTWGWGSGSNTSVVHMRDQRFSKRT